MNRQPRCSTVPRSIDALAPIAYLAPEIPALSATFVYEEILGLERLGVRVIPFTVHRPKVPAVGQSELAVRVKVLYGQHPVWLVLKGLFSLPTFGWKIMRALQCLVADMLEVGLMQPDSWKLVYQFLVGTQLARGLKQQGCSHLHIHFAHVPTQIGMYASLLSGVPFTVTAHANDIFERGLLLMRKAERAWRFLTISDYNLQFLKTQGIPAEQLGIVRCGVSLPAGLAPTRTRNDGGITRIGSLGRLVEKKGFDVLIKAVALLKERGHAIELSIAGDGPLNAALVSLANSLGVRGITVFEGALPHSQVQNWLSTLDVFALACKKDQAGDMDGIPVVLMEAMFQRLPVVSTRLSGIPELVINGETGFLAQPNDEVDFADQLERSMSVPSSSFGLTQNARIHVEREFSQANNLSRLRSYFPQPTNSNQPS